MSNKQLQSLVELFNDHSKSKILPTRKCLDLKEEKNYSIHYFKRIDTSVGDGILAALSDSPYKEGDVPRFQVFLPKRFVNILQNEDLELIQPGKLYIVSHGQCGNNTTELTLHINNSHVNVLVDS